MSRVASGISKKVAFVIHAIVKTYICMSEHDFSQYVRGFPWNLKKKQPLSSTLQLKRIYISEIFMTQNFAVSISVSGQDITCIASEVNKLFLVFILNLPQNLQQIHPCQGELEKKNIVQFKGTVIVISSESLGTDGNALFTKAPLNNLNPLSYHFCGKYCCFSRFKCVKFR